MLDIGTIVVVIICGIIVVYLGKYLIKRLLFRSCC